MVINEIETRSGVIESTFFFTPTSPNCYFSLTNQRADLNKRPVTDGLECKTLSSPVVIIALTEVLHQTVPPKILFYFP